jgi:hypothetical protein
MSKKLRKIILILTMFLTLLKVCLAGIEIYQQLQKKEEILISSNLT